MTASPLTGSNLSELLQIKTDKLSVYIKGCPIHPRLAGPISDAPKSKLHIVCSDTVTCTVLKRTPLQNQGHSSMNVIETKTSILFYEQQNYELVIEGTPSTRQIIEFYHDNLAIRNAVTPIGSSGTLLTGIINFRNEIGLSDLIIKVDGQPYLFITIEVFPTKMNYQEDYLALMADITDEMYNLAFDFVKKTYLQANPNDHLGNSATEYFSIIRAIFQRFLKAIDILIEHPHHILTTQTAITRADRIKSSSTETINWLRRHPEHVARTQKGYQIDKALAIHKEVTYDTRENRIIRHVLKLVVRKLTNIKAQYTRLLRDCDVTRIEEIDRMIRAIQNRLAFSFLKNVSDLNEQTSISLVFTMAPGYREVYKYHLMLLRGLSINGGVFDLSVKDVALLYEYWCFIKLNSLLKQEYRLVKQDILKIDNSGLFVVLQKGKKSELIYENPRNGERIVLAYNQSAGKLPTVGQKPDNILSLQKQHADILYQYVFDAKYKINPAYPHSFYAQMYHAPGPEETDINTMHRYRDAIVYENNQEGAFQRTMFGAFVLFPYNNLAEYKEHPFYKSIESVGIGGLPFLPSSTYMVSRFLNELILDSEESAFERATLPIGIEEKLAHYDFDKRDVLIGSLRNKAQFEICLKNNFYYTPAANIEKKRLPLHYIALYQSRQIFDSESGVRYYSEITNTHLVERQEITEIPTTRSRIKDLYYRFEIKKWMVLKQPIQLKEFGLRRIAYTNLYLLENSTFYPELLIQSVEQLRLYHELMRVSNEVTVASNESIVQGFKYNDATIFVNKDEIKVHNSARHRAFSRDEFHRHPRMVLKQVLGMVE